MYLDAVKLAEEISPNGNGFHEVSEENVYETWKDWPASEISHHGKMCCEMAREWVTGNDFSELNGASVLTGPRWLRQKFIWGASSFPICWCEAVQKKMLDCGALAALACEVFRSRGVKTLRVQMVQRFSDVSTFQWANSWSDGSAPLKWTHKDLIYHEGCAIITANKELKTWDASAGWWVDPKAKDGYGSLLAVRLSSIIPPAETHFRWGDHTLPMDQWTKLIY
jgi:hypothetical protein